MRAGVSGLFRFRIFRHDGDIRTLTREEVEGTGQVVGQWGLGRGNGRQEQSFGDGEGGTGTLVTGRNAWEIRGGGGLVGDGPVADPVQRLAPVGWGGRVVANRFLGGGGGNGIKQGAAVRYGRAVAGVAGRGDATGVPDSGVLEGWASGGEALSFRLRAAG